MNMKKILFWLSISVILWAEPSVYSRTSTYKGSNSATIYRLQQQIATLKEQVEGLKSIVESLSAKLAKGGNGANSTLNNSELMMLKDRLARLEAKVNRKNTNTYTQSKAISTNSTKKSINRVSSSNNADLNNLSSYKLYSKGVILFDKKHYSESKAIFQTLLKRKYKLASSNFYLGEIAYRTGKYRDAIKYYQKSAELDENAAYMDRLLLHTGISLENDGDKQQAKRFYEAIIDAYPNTSSARVAKKRLK